MISQDGFKVIGLSTRTTNLNKEASSAIGALWSEFITQNLLELIPNRIDSDILCIYTDYESDFTGEYTCILGMKVSSLDQIPTGMIGREFGNSNFLPFSAHGELPFSLEKTWEEIWSNDSTLNRAYLYDYEVYNEQSRLGSESEVSIYLSINE